MNPVFVHYYLGFLAFAFGACVGSFLNVCVYRIPRDMSVSHPPSHCPGCGHPIRWRDNVPIVAWLLLRGQCRDCGNRISPRYMLIETLTGALFLAAWLRPAAGSRFGVIIDWLLIAGLIAATFIDLEFYIIPNEITYGGMIAGLILSPIFPARFHGVEGPVAGLLSAAIGLVVGAGVLLAVAWLGEKAFRKEAMGLGDVKLLGMLGAFFGWQCVPFVLMVSSLGGSIVGISLMVSRRKGRSDPIPFGPYIALAALLWIFIGPQVVDWYLGFLTPPPPLL